MTERLQIDRELNNTVGEWISGPYQCARHWGDLKAKSANIRASKKSPPHDLRLKKYGISMYRGSHIGHNERIKAIGFDG